MDDDAAYYDARTVFSIDANALLPEHAVFVFASWIGRFQGNPRKRLVLADEKSTAVFLNAAQKLGRAEIAICNDEIADAYTLENLIGHRALLSPSVFAGDHLRCNGALRI